MAADILSIRGSLKIALSICLSPPEIKTLKKTTIIAIIAFIIPDLPIDSAPETAPISLEVPVRRINWGFEPGYKLIARREPMSAMPIGPVEKVKFIPYGCTNIRVTELPVAEVME